MSEIHPEETCPVIGANGPNLEPLRCAYPPGHDGPHSMDSLPTFLNGHTELERAAIEWVEAHIADDERMLRTGKISEPFSSETARRREAMSELFRLTGNSVEPLLGGAP